MSTFRFLVGRSLPALIVAVIVGVLSGLAGAGVIATVSEASSRASAQPGQLFAWFVVLAALSVLSKGVSEVLLTRIGQAAVADVRMQLSRSVLLSPLRQVEELGAHRVLAALQDDAAVITQAFVYLPLVCVNAATVVGCLAYLGATSHWTLALVILAMAVGTLIFRAHERRAREAFTAARETSDELFRHFRGLTSGIKELKMAQARGETFLTRLLGESARSYQRAFVSGMTTYSIATGWGTALFYAVLGAVVFVLPSALGLSSAQVSGATVTLLYMMAPFALLMEIVPSLGRAAVALEKWRVLGLSLVPEAAAIAEPTRSFETLKRIDLVDVTHRYYREREQGTFQLGPVNLTLRAGELVFLVGGNGSGKTTLSLLLLGLYQPDSGVIMVDGEPVDEQSRAHYRELFSVVFAEYHVFEQLLGLADPQQRERAQHYLARLELDHRVRIEGDNLRIEGLSTGQRKRLALLAAALDDRPFYLFDEWASDQDPQFRRIFYTELLPELRARGKAVLVITHDDQYFALADRCLRMDYGRLSESRVRQPERLLASAEAP